MTAMRLPAASYTSQGVHLSRLALLNTFLADFKFSALLAKRMYTIHARPYSVRLSESSLFFPLLLSSDACELTEDEDC